ncbi:MAG: hypothetical protein FD123_2683 [Bacteroidetes bacterium]|nr:MAG: hypothetical protein FD123_2683 [Bacteroidota bacterium]
MRIKLLFHAAALLFPVFITAQPASWSARGVGGGGALFSPAINPANTNELFIACDMSELFHSTDFGSTWSQVHFTELQGGHNSKVCFTSTTGLLYSVNYDDDMPVPAKSTDGGLTWSGLPGNPDNNEETFSIFADYNTPDRVIISYYGEIFISQDGGNNFTSIHTAINSGSGVTVGGVFFDGNDIWIGSNDGLLYSSNGGTSFTTVTTTGIPAGEQIWSFAGAKTGNTIRFFCLTGNSGDIYAGLVGSDYWDFMRGVYAMDWGTPAWANCMTSNGTDFPMFVAMAENDINTVYVSGSNNNSVPIVMKTTNAGLNWSHVFNSTNNQNVITGWSGQGGDRGWWYGECPFGISVARTNANVMTFGDFGFIHKTNDGGTTWQQAYVDVADQHSAGSNTPAGAPYHSAGIENTTCWQVHWSGGADMFAAFSDIRGVRSADGGASWSFNYSGLNANSTYRIAQHPSNGTLYSATSNIHDMYQSTRLQDNILDGTDNEGKILYSTDNGQTWQLLHNFGHPVFWITLDPNNPNRAYASVIHYNGGNGIGGIYRCDDLQNLAGSTWTLLSDPPRTQKHPASIVVLNDGNMICTFSGRRNGAGVFQNCSGTFIYNPSNGNWTDVSDPGMYYWTKDIVIDPNDAQQNTWYVGVFSGWGGPPNGLGGLYKTTNRGQSWTRISNNDRVTSCTFNPNNANEIYMTTEQDGLWICSNVNAGTPAFSLVNSYPFRQPERVFFNPAVPTEIWVTSFGNGMKTGSTGPTGIDFISTREAIRIYPNPVSDYVIVDFPAEPAPVELFDLTGKRLLRMENKDQQVRIDLRSFAPGVYFIRSGRFAEKIIRR